ncbi:MAG: hypothetical protein ACUVQX_03665 [Candidatus Bathycorpusculaceae bacterium]
MKAHKLLLSLAEALTIYGLIIFGYGVLVIHITQTWSGDWPVDRNIPWLNLDTFVIISFALSFFGFMVWRYLKHMEETK